MRNLCFLRAKATTKNASSLELSCPVAVSVCIDDDFGMDCRSVLDVQVHSSLPVVTASFRLLKKWRGCTLALHPPIQHQYVGILKDCDPFKKRASHNALGCVSGTTLGNTRAPFVCDTSMNTAMSV